MDSLTLPQNHSLRCDCKILCSTRDACRWYDSTYYV